MGKYQKTRDVATGRHTRPVSGAGREWKAHVGKEAWWVVHLVAIGPHRLDQHTFEVCLAQITPFSYSPTWPILALFDIDDAFLWEKRLRAFAKTLDPEQTPWDEEVNGDPRLAAWLTENGFHRYNHIWWSQRLNTDTGGGEGQDK